MLPTFMPVATQAAIKGLTAQQVESLGITLMLNNTYHMNLRPGINVLNEAGGAHRFQGWNRNLLTVWLLTHLSSMILIEFSICHRTAVASSLSHSANLLKSQKKGHCLRAHLQANPRCLRSAYPSQSAVICRTHKFSSQRRVFQYSIRLVQI
jgi:tRNA-guanine family transglycosylase